MKIHVVSADAALRRALVSRLRHAPGLNGTVEARTPGALDFGPDEVVIVPSSETTVRECAELVGRGAKVVVLAALPGDAEEASFVDAGAAYVTMAVDLSLLVQAIVDAQGSVLERATGSSLGDRAHERR